MEVTTQPDPQEEKEEESKYGWGKLKCMQCLNRPAWFLAFLSVSITAQSMTINGLVGVSITSIERRFGLTSTQAGWIPSAYELAGLPVLLVVGYLGGVNIHRPRWIAGGMFIVALGALIYCLPHFTTGLYVYSNNVLDLMCQEGTNVTAENCALDLSLVETGLSKYQGMFICGTVLVAIGAVPPYILGIPYMDDALTKEQSSLFLGILYSFSVVGPAIAFVGGGVVINTFYTDFDRVDVSTIDLSAEDPRYVGAWWVGFILCFILAMIVVFPLSGYPKKLPCDVDFATSKAGEVQSTGTAEEDNAAMQPGFGSSLKDVPRSLKILFTNLPFLFTCLYGTCDALLINGFTAFGPKYLENEYGLTAGTASIVFGAIAVPGGVGGFLFGSFLTKRLKLNCSQLLKANFIGSIIVMGLVVVLAAQCDNVRFAGVTEPYVAGESMSGLSSACSMDCGCSRGQFEPVCGADSLTYFSPCYAGCTAELSVDDVQNYANCSCVESVTGEWNATAVSGFCPQEGCILMPVFVVTFFLAMFLIFLCGIFHLTILLRCVPPSQRSLSLAVDWLLARGLGSMPGPLLFGAVLDKSCLLWDEQCEETGSCLYYDTHNMSWYLLGVCLASKFLSVIFGLIGWKTYRPRIRGEQSTDTLTNDSTHANDKNTEMIENYLKKNGNESQNNTITGLENPGYGGSREKLEDGTAL